MAVIFIITWFVLLFYAVRLIAKGWSAASELGGKQFINEQKRYVTRTVHPEMRDLKEGDELLIIIQKLDIKDMTKKNLKKEIYEKILEKI